MNKMVMLDYTFLFEPENSWSHLYQFEQDLSKFFQERGFEAEIVKTIDGQMGRRILLIKRVDPMFPPTNVDQSTVKDQLKKVESKFPQVKENKPKFIPTKGYLKR